jgi:adenylosuccinate synthase
MSAGWRINPDGVLRPAFYNPFVFVLRKQGGEFGTTTGRPRRCGWLDIPMLRYSHRINGYDSLNVTKLDVMTGFPVIKVSNQGEPPVTKV